MQTASLRSATRATPSPRCSGSVALPIGAACRRRVIAASGAPAPTASSEDNGPSASSAQQPSLLQVMRQLSSHACKQMSAAAFPIASVVASATANSTAELCGALSKALEIYLVLLTVRVLMSWFRNINWHREPFNIIRQFTDPYLSMFRGVVPPIGGMDLSPMLGFFLLSFAAKQLKRMSYGL